MRSLPFLKWSLDSRNKNWKEERMRTHRKQRWKFIKESFMKKKKKTRFRRSVNILLYKFPPQIMNSYDVCSQWELRFREENCGYKHMFIWQHKHICYLKIYFT